ncbi:MAG: hypothetical protein LBV36_08355 [Chromatiales bacterium]|nr:hypothetical protein [Chromatiales bacterium]
MNRPLVLFLAIVISVSVLRAASADDAVTLSFPDLPPPSEFDSVPASSADIRNEPGWLDRFTIGGYLKNETAFRFSEPRSITKIRNIVYLDGTYDFSDRYHFVFSGWAYHDLAYDLFDYQTISARFARNQEQPLVFIDNLAQQKDSPVAEFRELYLDMSFNHLDLRVGQQFVVWGVLEGVRVVDEINPLNFRELVLPDLLDYRIPLWTAKLDYYGAKGDWQFLWIPDLRFHKAAPLGSEWELFQDITDANGNVLTHYPARNFRNSELGVRYSTRWFDTDLSFSYFYTWDDFPVLFRSELINSAEDPTFFPAYTRMNMYGATAARPLGSGVLKAEAAYVPDKYFGLRSDTDRNGDGFLDNRGALRRQHIRWGLGYEFNHWGTDISPAITQWVILDYDDHLIQDHFDTSFTLFLRKPMPERSLTLQLLAIALINMHELYLKPKITLNVTDHFQIASGFDLFFGSPSQLGISGASSPLLGSNAIVQNPQFFGNFSHNDRVFVEFRYTF